MHILSYTKVYCLFLMEVQCYACKKKKNSKPTVIQRKANVLAVDSLFKKQLSVQNHLNTLFPV